MPIYTRQTIFFNEAEHKYTDQLGNNYTSTTTVIGKYYDKFDMRGRAEMCSASGLRGNPKYRTKDGKRALTADEIIFQWTKLKDIGCERGNERHNFLEDTIKTANNYKRTGLEQFINDKIYTVPDILDDHNYGRIDLSFFVKTGIAERYPVIYKILEHYTIKGYRIYAEIGVYWYDFLISGLIDVLLVKDDHFIVLDWKTNKDEIRYEAGYFEKDFEGNRTGKFIPTPGDYFHPPLQHLPASVGYKYTLQCSMYGYLTELFGLYLKNIILCQINHDLYTDETLAIDDVADKFMGNSKNDLIGKERVSFYPIKYMKNEIALMCADHTEKINKTRNKQFKLEM